MFLGKLVGQLFSRILYIFGKIEVLRTNLESFTFTINLSYLFIGNNCSNYYIIK